MARVGGVHGRQVGAVLIAKLDRCTRSVADLASLIDTFSRRGVALISAAESLDTSGPLLYDPGCRLMRATSGISQQSVVHLSPVGRVG